MLFLKRVYI